MKQSTTGLAEMPIVLFIDIHHAEHPQKTCQCMNQTDDKNFPNHISSSLPATHRRPASTLSTSSSQSPTASVFLRGEGLCGGGSVGWRFGWSGEMGCVRN